MSCMYRSFFFLSFIVVNQIMNMQMHRQVKITRITHCCVCIIEIFQLYLLHSRNYQTNCLRSTRAKWMQDNNNKMHYEQKLSDSKYNTKEQKKGKDEIRRRENCDRLRMLSMSNRYISHPLNEKHTIYLTQSSVLLWSGKSFPRFFSHFSILDKTKGQVQKNIANKKRFKIRKWKKISCH